MLAQSVDALVPNATRALQKALKEKSTLAQTFDALQLLRGVLGDPKADFKSASQARGVITSLFTQHDMVAILPTGGGKSLFFLLPPLIQETVTVVFLPLNALLDQFSAKAQELGIPTAVWPERLEGHRGLQLCHMQRAKDEALQVYLNELFAKGKLERLVLDEVQVLEDWAAFQASLNGLKWIRVWGVPVTVLSGTLTSAQATGLVESFNLTGPIITEPLPRLNNEYSVIRLPTAPITKSRVSAWVSDYLQSKKGDSTLTLVYCMTKESVRVTVEALKKAQLPCVSVTADDSDEMRRGQLEQWTSGKPSIMVCTSTLGMGLDVPNVRRVFFLGGAYSLGDLLQGFGRAGRDGASSQCFLVVDSNPNKRWSQGIREAIEKEGCCLRASFGELADETASNCLELKGAALCAVCRGEPGSHGGLPTTATTTISASPLPSPAAMASALLPLPNPRKSTQPSAAATHLETAAQQVHHDQARTLEDARRIQDYFQKNECLICSFGQIHAVRHPPEECPWVGRMCHGCGSLEHSVMRCPHRVPVKPSLTCGYCCLPLRVGHVNFHDGDLLPMSPESCQSGARDRLMPFVFYLYASEHLKAQLQSEEALGPGRLYPTGVPLLSWLWKNDESLAYSFSNAMKVFLWAFDTLEHRVWESRMGLGSLGGQAKSVPMSLAASLEPESQKRPIPDEELSLMGTPPSKKKRGSFPLTTPPPSSSSSGVYQAARNVAMATPSSSSSSWRSSQASSSRVSQSARNVLESTPSSSSSSWPLQDAAQNWPPTCSDSSASRPLLQVATTTSGPDYQWPAVAPPESSVDSLVNNFPRNSVIFQDSVGKLTSLLQSLGRMCPLCLMAHRTESHKLTRCSVMLRRCIKCHQSQNSPHDCFLAAPWNFVDEGVCPRCFLPDNFPVGHNTMSSCSNKGSDTLRPLCIQIWFLPLHSPLREGVFEFFSLPQALCLKTYCKWLCTPVQDMPLTYIGLVGLFVQNWMSQHPRESVTRYFAD